MQVLAKAAMAAQHLHQPIGDGVMPSIHSVVQQWADGLHDPVAGLWILQTDLPHV